MLRTNGPASRMQDVIREAGLCTKRSAAILIAIAILVFECVSAPSHAAAPSSRPKRQYLVIGKPDHLTKPMRKTLSSNGATVVGEIVDAGVAVVTTSDQRFPSRMKRNESVLGVVEDSKVQMLATAPSNMRKSDGVRNDGVPSGEEESDMCPKLDLEHSEHIPWNIHQIKADLVRSLQQSGQPSPNNRVKVAVLDTGVNTAHVDLAPNIDRSLSRSFVASEPAIEDLNSHGSHVAGVIAATRNGRGVQGVAPDASIVALKVLDANGNGRWSSVLEALRYAADIKADVVNMSFSQSFDITSQDARLLKEALDRSIKGLRTTGALVVASAGNEGIELGTNTLVLPAQNKNVVTVSATGPIEGRQFDRLASYSNYGRGEIDLAAPGGDLVSELSYPCDMVLSAAAQRNGVPDQWSWHAGTSVAAPHVAGVAALVKGRFKRMPPEFIESWMEQTSDDISSRGRDAESGWGRINAAKVTLSFWGPPSVKSPLAG